jgi:hypothetical protein
MGDSQPISGRCSGQRRARFSKSEAVPIFLILAGCLTGQNRPPQHMEVFRAVSEALANQDADAFLDQFDRQMAEYEKLRDEIRELIATAQEIGSTLDVITDAGDEQKRTLELDWLLKIDNAAPRRQIVKCQVAAQGKKWKITAFDPVEFFRK